MTYSTVSEMPEWARSGIQNLIDLNLLSGRDKDNLDVSDEMMRILLITRRMFARAGLLDVIAANA